MNHNYWQSCLNQHNNPINSVKSNLPNTYFRFKLPNSFFCFAVSCMKQWVAAHAKGQMQQRDEYRVKVKEIKCVHSCAKWFITSYLLDNDIRG